VSDKIKTDHSSIKPSEEEKAKWFDAPFFVGAGLKIAFVSIEARYHRGTLESYNFLYNRYIQVGVAFTF